MELLLPEVFIGQLFWSWVAFLILFFALSKYAFPPIMNMLQERSDSIRDSLEAAENTREEAATMLEDYKKQMAEARQEAQKIIEDGRKLGESMKEDIVKKSREEVEQVMTRATADIEREKELALAELQGRIADLTIGAASRVVGAELEKQGHEQLIEEYLSEVGSLREN